MSFSDVLKKWENDSPFYEIYTSGSTGKPKKIKLEKNRMKTSAQMSLDYFQLNKGDNVLLALPTDKVGGAMLCVRAIVGGLNVVEVEPRLNPLGNIDLKKEITFCSLTPAQLNVMMEHEQSRRQLSMISKILLGGSDITPALEKLIREVPAECYHSYGMTETISHVAVRNLTEKDKYFEAVGNVRFKVNQEGRLTIVAPEILNEELLTNDVVELDGERRMRWKGRIDNVVNTGGVKLQLEEIELKIRKVFEGEFYLVKDKDEIFGEKVVMVSKEEVEEEVFEALNKRERPSEIVISAHFAYTNNGKLLRLKPQQLKDL